MSSDMLLYCLYCDEYVGNHDDIREHDCFMNFDDGLHDLLIQPGGDGIELISYTENCGPSNENSNVGKDDEANNTIDTCNANKVNFTVAMEEKLITLVQEKRPLYDFRMPVKERTKLKKQQHWKDIANEFESESFDVEFLESKWKYLRNCFTKAEAAHKKKVVSVKKSGSAYQEIKKPTFRHYHLMSFLKDVMEPLCKSASSISIQMGEPSVQPQETKSISPSHVKNSKIQKENMNYGFNSSILFDEQVQRKRPCDPNRSRLSEFNQRYIENENSPLNISSCAPQGRKKCRLSNFETNNIREDNSDIETTIESESSRNSCRTSSSNYVKRQRNKKPDDIELELIKCLTGSKKQESSHIEVQMRGMAMSINTFSYKLQRECMHEIQNIVYDYQVKSDREKEEES